MEIEQNYIINNKTCGIIPAKQIDYDSIVVEEETLRYIQQTPMQIVESSCIHYWSTYEGRRQSVIHHTGFKEKVPIPIIPQTGVVTFPTHGLRDLNCCWLMHDQILQYEPINHHEQFKTAVTFANRKRLRLDVSIRSFESQMKRAFEVKFRTIKHTY